MIECDSYHYLNHFDYLYGQGCGSFLWSKWEFQSQKKWLQTTSNFWINLRATSFVKFVYKIGFVYKFLDQLNRNNFFR